MRWPPVHEDDGECEECYYWEVERDFYDEHMHHHQYHDGCSDRYCVPHALLGFFVFLFLYVDVFFARFVASVVNCLNDCLFLGGVLDSSGGVSGVKCEVNNSF